MRDPSSHHGESPAGRRRGDLRLVSGGRRRPARRRGRLARLRLASEAAAGRLARQPLFWLLVVPLAALGALTLILRLGGVVGWDAAAHLYKIALLQEGQSIFWDNNWYGGAYQIVSYGFIFYWLAQYVSYSLIVAVSAGAMPVLFHLYMRRVYGVTSYLPAIALAVVMGLYLSNGQDPFLFALGLMMGGLVLLGYRRPLLAAIPMAIAAFANPLAVVVAGVFLVAALIGERELRRPILRLVLYLLPFVAARLLLSLVFWEPSAYYYRPIEILIYVLYGVVGVLVLRISLDPRRSSKEVLFATFAVVAVLVAVVPANPVGGNIGRFFFIFGVPLLLCVRDVALPRAITVPLLVAIGFGQLITPALHYVHIVQLPSTRPEFFAPALAFANMHRDPAYRFHVVALDTHWEAYYFSLNEFAITRGWYRQDDALHNDVLTKERFSAVQYVAWLRDMGVKYVFLPHAPLDLSGKRETEILESSRQFTVVAEMRDWTIYRLEHPEPMIEPLRRSGEARILDIDHQAVYLDVDKPGAYLIKISYSPYWQLTSGLGELRKGRDNFLVLRADGTGFYQIRVKVTFESSWQRLVTAI